MYSVFVGELLAPDHDGMRCALFLRGPDYQPAVRGRVRSSAPAYHTGGGCTIRFCGERIVCGDPGA